MAFRIGKRSDFKKPAVGRTDRVLRRRSIEHLCRAETGGAIANPNKGSQGDWNDGSLAYKITRICLVP